MRKRFEWFPRLIDRVLANGTAGEGWREIGEHRITPAREEGESARVWLTIAQGERPRSVEAWPELGGGDLLAIEALLARPGARWLNETTRTLATTRGDGAVRVAARPPTTSVIVRGFDAWWTPGAGGWLRLRFRGGASCRTEFAAADAPRFAACVAAAAAPEAVFDPRTLSIRSRPAGIAIGGLALAR